MYGMLCSVTMLLAYVGVVSVADCYFYTCGGTGAVVADSGFAGGDRGDLAHGICTPLEPRLDTTMCFVFYE